MRAIALAVLVCAPLAAQRIVRTVAGTDPYFTGDGMPATSAAIGSLYGIAVDGQGRPVVSLSLHNLVARIEDGVLRVIAGTGFAGPSGDGGSATLAGFDLPHGVAVDRAGVLYIVDRVNGEVRRVAADGVMTTLASGLVNPRAIALDGSGAVHVSDIGLQQIVRVSGTGVRTVVAGSGRRGFTADGASAASANLDNPVAIAFGPDGSLYFAEAGSFGASSGPRIRRIAADGTLRTVAGNGQKGFAGDGGPATAAALSFDIFTTGIAVDGGGNVFFPDTDTHVVRKVTPAGTITTVAGIGEMKGFAGDGGPANSSLLNSPLAVALDGSGRLYIADSGNARVRVMDESGVIATVAGNGQELSIQDPVPATSAFIGFPDGLTVGGDGSLYFVDSGAQRIRRIGADGVVTTVAGTGEEGFRGDGGPATQAALSLYTLDTPGVAVNGTGTVYFSDPGNSRVRRVTPDGTIDTVAGNGSSSADGEGVPARDAGAGAPIGIAVEADGSLVFTDSLNGRIRRVSPAGLISTIGGNRNFESSGDGGPARSANFDRPSQIAADRNGNLYVTERFRFTVRRIDRNGTVTRFAGNGEKGTPRLGPALSSPFDFIRGLTVDGDGNVYVSSLDIVWKITPQGQLSRFAGREATDDDEGVVGDGMDAADAVFRFLGGLAFSPAGTLYLSDGESARIRAVAPAAPVVSAVPSALSFAVQSGGARDARKLLVDAVVAAPGLGPAAGPVPGLVYSIATPAEAPWLKVEPKDAAGVTPSLLEVAVDPEALAPGNYTATITITAPLANPAVVTVPVSVTVGAAQPPRLTVESGRLSFTYSRQSAPRAQSLTVRNSGGGSLQLRADAQTEAGGTWLRVDPLESAAAAGSAVAFNVTADPAGLAAGVYRGQVSLAASPGGQSAIVPVTMTISSNARALLLSQTGLVFTAIAQGGTPVPQSLAAISAGTGDLDIDLAPSTVTGGPWLRLSSPARVATPAAPALVTATVDASTLAPGQYYGLAGIRAPGAANTPQAATVFLDVLPAGTDIGSAIRPSELVFPAGASLPGARELFIYNPTSTPKSFRATASPELRNRVALLPAAGTVAPDRPLRVLAQPVAFPPERIVRGTILFRFDDGRTVEAAVTLIDPLAEAAPLARKQRRADAPCIPSELVATFTSIGSGFDTPAGWPVALQADVRDNCGAPLERGSVVAQFSNRDVPLSLTPVRDGRWDGTWQTSGSTAGVTVTLQASSADKSLKGSRQVTGTLGAARTPPSIPRDGVTDAASGIPLRPLAPGSAIVITGGNLADQSAEAAGSPYPASLGSTSVVFAGRTVPLAAVSPNRISGILPYGVDANTQQQLIVMRADTLSLPVQVDVAAASPAVFPMISGVDGRLITPQAPARTGELLSIFCTGLGELSESVSAGEAGPAASVARLPVAVTMGGVAAAVSYAGLAPGVVGVYVIKAAVPAGVAGDQVPVVVSSAATPPAASPAVTVAIR